MEALAQFIGCCQCQTKDKYICLSVLYSHEGVSIFIYPNCGFMNSATSSEQPSCDYWDKWTWNKVILFFWHQYCARVYLLLCMQRWLCRSLCIWILEYFWLEINPAYCLWSIDACSWKAACVAGRESSRKEGWEKEQGERSVNKNTKLRDVAHPKDISGRPLIEKEANEAQLIITL